MISRPAQGRRPSLGARPFLTNRCDFACPMCAVQDARDEGLARGGDLPFEFVEKVLAECSAYQPVVDFIGGEPLLYSQLSNAVKLASQRNVLSVVTTNGLKLKDKAEALVRAKLPILQVSLDGWDDLYLTSEQVRDLKSSLQPVQQLNRGLRLRIAYAWNIDLEAYYSTRQASRSLVCDLPHTRLDIHTDGHMAVCVSGKRVVQVGCETIGPYRHFRPRG